MDISYSSFDSAGSSSFSEDAVISVFPHTVTIDTDAMFHYLIVDSQSFVSPTTINETTDVSMSGQSESLENSVHNQMQATTRSGHISTSRIRPATVRHTT